MRKPLGRVPFRSTATVVGAVLAGIFTVATSAGTATAATGLEGIPAYSHIVTIVLENEGFDSTYGPASPATYLKSLVPQGVLATNYYATGHASLDNYIAMTSGQPDQPLTGSDCATVNLYTCVQGQQAMSNGANVGDQLDAAGLGWKQYADGISTSCLHASYSPTAGTDPYQGAGASPPPAGPNYADRHVPFLYYSDVVGNDARCQAHDVPYSQLSTDITNDTVPAYSFVTPDTCNDGHDNPCAGKTTGGLTAADAWLSANIPSLLSYLQAHNGLLVITTDESSTSDTTGCCHGGPGGGPGFGGRVGLLALGPGVKAGQTISTAYDHASLLRTVEDSFGISSYLNNASSSVAMRDLFVG
ncbi:MAG TPA: alkaline phosphatase family protein [Acidimicrobiales bacterium]